ncbi:DJ-1/PfpI family protein [Candidatus Micrarchaeota archaeon]|nr:DJ-1/PfpI family protein [Candidatus Micrarchaeota archaeon]
MNLEGKKVVMIIAPEKFRDEELFVPKEYLEGKGVEVTVASTKKGTCTGALGGTVEAEKTLGEVNVEEYNAVVFVGGGGTPVIRAEERALEIIKEAAKSGKIAAGICWASTTLAKAGVLEGKNATVWVGNDAEYGMETNKVLEKYGATYVDKPVVVDGNVVTAVGPSAAKEFAKEIEKLLQ